MQGDSIFFTSEAGNAVLSLPIAGGRPQVLAQVTAPTQLAVDKTHVYFVTFARNEPGGSVSRVARQGGPAEVLSSGHLGLDNPRSMRATSISAAIAACSGCPSRAATHRVCGPKADAERPPPGAGRHACLFPAGEPGQR